MTRSDTPALEGQSVAVVGAGIAGLAAARRLAKAGADVTVFEKSRGCGGRLATRRLEAGGADHGAQYVTAREPGFKAFAARARALGSLAPWQPRGKDDDGEWLVGVPGMRGLVDPLIDGFTVATERRVTAIIADEARFRLQLDDDAVAGPYDRVVVAVPAPQALPLLEPFGAPFERIAEARFGPCWTLIAAFDAPVDPGFDVVRAVGPIAWMARSASKPGRQGEIWVIQADPTWSRAHLEEPAEAVAAQLLDLSRVALGALPAPSLTSAHRWRFALVEKAVGETFLIAPDGRIGACGDWLIAPRVESAYASGDGLAEAMIARAGGS